MKIILNIITIILFLNASNFSQTVLPDDDIDSSFDDRAAALVAKMTLEEKISQMTHESKAIERLGIPEYNWWNEGLHGIARNGIATVFPQAIGLAATWDRDLLYRVSTVISDEARAKYNQALSRNKRGIYQGLSIWSPNINIFRDPRWGRGMETYGEDPYLTGELGVQFIKGLQGNSEKYLKTIATPKHLAVHSGPEPLRHTFNAIVNEYDLRETYLPQFKKCIIDGEAYSIMCAYNRFRGDACCGSDPLIKHILRNEWGFKGFMVSDCWAVPDMFNYHKIVETAEEAASIAVKSGTDLECGNAYPSLLNAVKEGLITEEEIDVSLKRTLTARFKLGMFDPVAMNPYNELIEFDTEANKEVALEATRKSIVLLKNKDNTLPFKKDVNKVAVLGPNANDVEVLLGNYSGFPSNPITPYKGIKDKLSDSEVIYERGCELAEGMPSFDIVKPEFLFVSTNNSEQGLKGEYFNNSELQGDPLFTRIDENIDFAWWDQAPFESFDPDNYGVRWSGYLVPPKSGKYCFGGYGFNGFKIYLDDSLIVQFDGEFDPVKTYKYVQLEANRNYKLKVEFYKNLRYSFMQLLWSIPDENLEQRAIEAAKNSDLIVMCMGLSPRLEGEELKLNIKGFEGGDRITLGLPESQSKFIKKVYSLGKPIVLVLLNGSALSINWENEHLPAIIEAWYPGQSGGTAISDIIFGDYNPAGRLPITFYKSIEQLPAFTDYDMENRTYRYFKDKPLYPFGYGLSYTTFEYSDVSLKDDLISRNDSTVLDFTLSNIGNYDGEEVIQLYIKAEKDTVTNKSLKDFKRINLMAKEMKHFQFVITPEMLQRWNDKDGYIVQNDTYIISIGGSSQKEDLKSIKLTVVN